MIYFISGHRDLTQEEFDKFYKPTIDSCIEDNKKIGAKSFFNIGDYEGADLIAQEYLKELCEKNVISYSDITIFHMFDKPRHCASERFHTIGGFKSDVERDSAMTTSSFKDIAFIRKGKWKSGTAQNILRRYEVLEKK